MQERFETFTVLISRISRDIRRIKNQEMAVYLIQSGSRSPAGMERWVNKIATLEQKKQHYEEILRRELDMDF